MTDDKADRIRRQWEDRARQPFVPSDVRSGHPVPEGERIASALEYIAAQLGQIGLKLDALLQAQPPQKP